MGHDGQHHRHLDQHSNNCRQRCSRLKSGKTDGGGHCQLEEVACPDQRCGSRYAPSNSEAPTEPVCQSSVEVDLDQDRHGQHGNHERLREDRLALEAEQQHQRRQERDKRNRPKPTQQGTGDSP